MEKLIEALNEETKCRTFLELECICCHKIEQIDMEDPSLDNEDMEADIKMFISKGWVVGKIKETEEEGAICNVCKLKDQIVEVLVDELS